MGDLSAYPYEQELLVQDGLSYKVIQNEYVDLKDDEVEAMHRKGRIVPDDNKIRVICLEKKVDQNDTPYVCYKIFSNLFL